MKNLPRDREKGSETVRVERSEFLNRSTTRETTCIQFFILDIKFSLVMANQILKHFPKHC